MDNYEQKYKEALEKAREFSERWQCVEAPSSDLALEEIKEIFPELKESEDEKVRKELLEHCKNQAKPYIQTGNKCPQIQSWIDWLEKQGRKKPHWTRKDSSMQLMLMRDIEQVSFLSEEGKTERIMWVNSLDDRFAPNSELEDDCENVKRCIGMILTDAAEQRFEDFNTNLKECLEWVINC